jgi:UDP-N-acetyl-2-amino-2-deoxyglucuronate dehydrogenase
VRLASTSSRTINTIDLLLWMFGEVLSVQACKATAAYEIEAEDTLIAVLEFSNCALGSFMATTCVYPGYPHRIELSGSNGTIILSDDQLVAGDLRQTMKEQVEPSEDGVDLRAPSPAAKDFRPHQAVFEDFIRRSSRTRNRRVTAEARRSLATVEAICLACRTGQREVLSGEPFDFS